MRLPPKPVAPVPGTLTRAADLATVTPQMEEMRRPIDNLYRAWQTLDIDLYLSQWSPSALQYSTGIHRTFPEIAARRRQDFARLASVTVARYQVVYRGFAEGVGHFDAEYSMRFNYRDGHEITENERESYDVVKGAGANRWVIQQNHDYIKR